MAVLTHRERLDGIAVIVQQPARQAEEVAYLQETMQASYAQMAVARERVLALLTRLLHRRGDRLRTALAVEIVQQLAQDGHFPLAQSACDNGVSTLERTRYIAGVGKPWVSALESSRHLQEYGQWQRVDAVAVALQTAHAESVRPLQVRGRKGATQPCWVFTKVVRRKRDGRKRLVIVHEQ
jgi:hypothetical protein